VTFNEEKDFEHLVKDIKGLEEIFSRIKTKIYQYLREFGCPKQADSVNRLVYI